MTSAIDYTAATRTVQTAFSTTLDRWKDGLNSVTDQFRALPVVGTLPQVDATGAVERQFAFIQQIVDLNHRYARQLAEVANTLSGVTREQLESVTSVVRDQVETVSAVARQGVDTVEQTAREQADEVEQAERQQARAAAKAQREERKEAEEKARAPHAELTKAELSELAAKRNLPKTGTVDELVARLVEADAK
jgi:Ran GTPase-activating protein (RanGAP) involved in mRNA processing and transport